MQVKLTKIEAAALVKAGLESDDSPIILKGDVQAVDIRVTTTGVILEVMFAGDPTLDPE
jgi:hypothetical protein